MISIEEVRKIAKKSLEKNKLKEIKEIDKGIKFAAKKGKMYLITRIHFLDEYDIKMIYERQGYKIDYWFEIPGCRRVSISWGEG